MMAQVIKQRGAKTVLMSGIIDYPLEKAKEAGVDYICNTYDESSPYYTPDLAARVKELTDGYGANRVIVPVAAESAFKDAFTVSGKASTIVFFGLPGEKDVIKIPALETLQSDKHVIFSWLAPYTWNEALSALTSGKLKAKELVTHRFPLDKVREGIEFMGSGEKEKIKGMIIN
jgi:L-iditol 2-dehydrogenase